MAKNKNGGAKKRYQKVVGFRPSPLLVPLLQRLERLPHVRKTWAFNRAMAAGLPAVLDEIGA